MKFNWPVGATIVAVLTLATQRVFAWELPPDNGTFKKEQVAEILGANDYAETSGYKQK